MADHHSHGTGSENPSKEAMETTDSGCFDFHKKTDEKKRPKDVMMADADNAGEKKVEQKPIAPEKLHRSDSNSSLSSDGGGGGGGGEKKKENGLKEKIKQKISGEKEGADPNVKDNSLENVEAAHPEEKKGFLEKIKEKPSGQHNKAEEGAAAGCCIADVHHADGEAKEKKGILEKIMDKMPGHHNDDDKDKERRNKLGDRMHLT